MSFTLEERKLRDRQILAIAKRIKEEMSEEEHVVRVEKVASLGIKGPTFREYLSRLN